jgi:hypothetical protein
LGLFFLTTKCPKETQKKKGGDFVNRKALRSVMVLHGDTNSNLAELLGISLQSVSNKLNENGSEFKQGEILKIKERYNLSAEQVESIFFASEVS